MIDLQVDSINMMILAVDDHQQCDTHGDTAAVLSQLIMIYGQPINDHHMVSRSEL